MGLPGFFALYFFHNFSIFLWLRIVIRSLRGYSDSDHLDAELALCEEENHAAMMPYNSALEDSRGLLRLIKGVDLRWVFSALAIGGFFDFL